MPDRIRFHLDEHVDPDIARALRRHAIDVTTTVEAGLRTKDDEAQFAYVLAQHRVLVTHDPGFLRFAHSHADHPGISFCPKAQRPIGDVIRHLVLIYEVLTPEEMVGRVEYL